LSFTTQSDWKVFNRTGISHLVSISGLHITMVAGLFAALVAALWRRSFFTGAELPLRLPAQKAAALAGAAIALLYVLLAGFGVPAQRTLYMLSVVAAALWLGRITQVSQVLCAALGIVVLLDPWAVLWPGFWLSFGAVAIILFVSVGRAAPVAESGAGRRFAALRAAALVQYAITLGLVPLTMLLFGQISLVGPIANALAIPLVSFLVTPLALIGAFSPAPLSDWLLGAAHFLVAQLAAFLQYLSGLPLAVWSAPLPSAFAFGCALAGVLWLLAPRGWPLRWLGAFALLPLFLTMPAHPTAGQIWLTAFDVGQGTALLIETSGHRLLYDTGPAYSAESDGGSRVIVPYLKARGIGRLDGMIVSHSDTDHSGGALSVLGEIEVGWLASSLPSGHALAQAAGVHRRCEAGQGWDWDGVRFEMLHPTAASYDSDKWKPNARSCTLRVSSGERAILLTGDIEAVQEAELVEASPEKLRSTVLLAPHHGSGTSSTPPFLQAVAPEVALFQVGYRNRYRHPKAEIYQRYAELGIRRLRSDESGAVELRFGEELRITEYRREHARYWYQR
jgi:competence protein ComEC